MPSRLYAGKPTIRAHKEKIKELEAQLNERLGEIDTANLPPDFRKELDELSRMKPKSRGLKIDFARYERELEYALQWDMFTPYGRRQVEERERKAFDTFKRKSGISDLDYDEWRNLVESFGSAGKSVMEQFYRGGQGGNGDIVRVYKDAKEQGKDTNIGRAMQKVLRDSRKEGFKYKKTPTGLLDALRDELGLDS